MKYISEVDSGYIEMEVTPGKSENLDISIGVRKADNPLQIIVNSIQMPIVDFVKMVKGVSGPIFLDNKEK